MKLIIIDDCDATIGIMKIYVRKIKAYHPRISPYYFKNAEDALKEIKKNNVSLIVCDMNLGGPNQMNAFDLAERIEAEMSDRQYPFLVISGSEIDSEEAENRGLYFMAKAELHSSFVSYCTRTISLHKTHNSIISLKDELIAHKEDSKKYHKDVLDSLQEIHTEQKRTTKERIGGFIASFWPKPIKALTGADEKSKK